MSNEYEEEDPEVARIKFQNVDGLSHWALASAMIAVGDRTHGPQDAAGFLKHYDDVVRRSIEKNPHCYDVEHLNNIRACFHASLYDQVNWQKHIDGLHKVNLN